MKNKAFTVVFNKETGGICQLLINSDQQKMNWVKPPISFGVPTFSHNVKFYGATTDFQLDKFEESEKHAVAFYHVEQLQTRPQSVGREASFPELTARAEYSFDENGDYKLKVTE